MGKQAATFLEFAAIIINSAVSVISQCKPIVSGTPAAILLQANYLLIFFSRRVKSRLAIKKPAVYTAGVTIAMLQNLLVIPDHY